MKKVFLTFSATFLLFLAGCAGIVRSDFAGNQKYPDIKSAKLSSKSIGQVEYGDSKNIKISSDSPSIDSGSLKGKYEIVSVHGEKGQSYTMTIAAICDCLGFRKWSVVPFSYVLDNAGNILSTGKFATPNVQSLAGVFPENGDYYVMVVADGTSEGKKVGEVGGGLAVPGKAYVPDSLTLSMTSHPTGIVQVNFHKAK